MTLELAIAGVPIAVCYKLDWFYRRLKQINRFIPIGHRKFDGLANIILGRNVVPEFLDDEVAPERLGPVLADLLRDSAARAEQVTAFEEIEERMVLTTARHQAIAPPRIVCEVARR